MPTREQANCKPYQVDRQAKAMSKALSSFNDSYSTYRAVPVVSPLVTELSDNAIVKFRYLPCIQCKYDGKDQETIQSSTTPDPGYHIGPLWLMVVDMQRDSEAIPIFKVTEFHYLTLLRKKKRYLLFKAEKY